MHSSHSNTNKKLVHHEGRLCLDGYISMSDPDESRPKDTILSLERAQSLYDFGLGAGRGERAAGNRDVQ
jgi:hypothetical protein